MVRSKREASRRGAASGWAVLALGGALFSACQHTSTSGSDDDSPSGGAADGGDSSTGATPSGGAAASGGGQAIASGGGGAEATGGASAGAGGLEPGGGAGGNSGTCDDDFSCPELGDCHLKPDGEGCQRVCSLMTELKNNDDVALLSSLRCEVVEGAISILGEVDSLAGLETIRTISGALLIEAELLEDLSGLVGIEELGALSIHDLPSLTSVRWPALRAVAEGLSVIDCPAMTEIDLGALETVGENLVVAGNTSLFTLHELPSLIAVPDIAMQRNSKLPQCEVVAIVSRVGASCNAGCSGNDEQATCD